MQWIDSSLGWIRDSLSLQPREDSIGQNPIEATRTHSALNEQLPNVCENHEEVIQVPGMWKQDANEVKWAAKEALKCDSELITIKCTLR